MQIVSSTDSWDLSTRQIDIGLLVSATNTAGTSTGSATIAINGQTVATGVSVANKAASNETIQPTGADKSSLTIHSVYAKVTQADAPVTVTVTAEAGSADLLWCYAHSTAIPYAYTNEATGEILYGEVGNAKPRSDVVNVNLESINPIGNVQHGGWRTIESGANVTVDITGILGSL
jgi:hypothetical protein